MRQEFTLAPEYRRSAVYAILGAVAATGVMAYVVKTSEGMQTWVSVAVTAILFGGLAGVLALWSVRARVALDEYGVQVRGLGGWRTWTWQDFASGRVSSPFLGNFIDPGRRWGQRGINLGYLSEADLDVVLRACLPHWRDVEPEPLPDSLHLKLKGWKRRGTQISMRDTGIDVLEGVRLKSIRWGEVLGVEMARLTPKHVGFRSLMLQLPGQEIELNAVIQSGEVRLDWKGASPAEVARYVERHALRDRIICGHLHGEPESSDDLRVLMQIRIRRSNADIRKLAQGVRAFWLFLFIAFPVIVWESKVTWPAEIGLLAIYSIPTVPLLVYMHLNLRARRREVAQMQETLEGLSESGE